MRNMKDYLWQKLLSGKAVSAQEIENKYKLEKERYGCPDDNALNNALTGCKKLAFAGFGIGGLGLIGFVLLCANGFWICGLLLLLLMICLGVCLFCKGMIVRTKLMKYSLVYPIINEYFSPDVYVASKCVDDAVVDEVDVVDDWENAFASDYFSGNWKGVKFSFGDVCIYGQGERQKGKECAFSGQMFVIETGLALKAGIAIHERKEPLSAEVYAGMKNSERFFMTGNEKFDRQFEVHLGSRQNVSGFEHDIAGVSPEEQRRKAHALVDAIAQDILDADSYAVSHTTMRFVGDHVYLSIENSRDTFEFMEEDFKDLDQLKRRLDEEVRDMTLYLDLVTRNLEHLKGKDI